MFNWKKKKIKEKARQQRNDPIHSFIGYHKRPFLYKLCPAVCQNHKNQYRHSDNTNLCIIPTKSLVPQKNTQLMPQKLSIWLTLIGGKKKKKKKVIDPCKTDKQSVIICNIEELKNLSSSCTRICKNSIVDWFQNKDQQYIEVGSYAALGDHVQILKDSLIWSLWHSRINCCLYFLLLLNYSAFKFFFAYYTFGIVNNLVKVRFEKSTINVSTWRIESGEMTFWA